MKRMLIVAATVVLCYVLAFVFSPADPYSMYVLFGILVAAAFVTGIVARLLWREKS